MSAVLIVTNTILAALLVAAWRIAVALERIADELDAARAALGEKDG